MQNKPYIPDFGRKRPTRRSRGTFPGLLFFTLLLALLAGWFPRTPEPARAAERADAAAIAEAIERLPVVGSVLLTGAHPDDENSTLLPFLTKKLHLRAAYLSTTRGDGGQNLLGNEQYEALGILRTEELLAGRRIDGAEQYFAQAYDFGFSKSAEETFQKWGHEPVLGDFVRILRTYRPDILISRFSGTPADGHGHHQAAGILTREAFRAAADPQRFPEQLQEGLQPWQASRFYLNRGGPGGSGGGGITLRLDGFDPLYGLTYPELGIESRSMHRSQGMGGGRGGSATTSFQLQDSAEGVPGTAGGLFDGLDTTLHRFTRLAGDAPPVADHVAAIQKAIEAARQSLSPYQPDKVLPALAQCLQHLRDMRDTIERGNVPPDRKDQALFLLRIKEADFVRAILLAGGVHLEALSDSEEVVPGETFTVMVTGLVAATDFLQAVGVELTGPPGWKIEKLPGGEPSPASKGRAEAKFRVTVPPNAEVSQPYWLIQPRTGDYFPTPRVPWVGVGENPALLRGRFQISPAAEGKLSTVEDQADVVYNYTDRVYGEREKPLMVVPALGVWVEPKVAAFPTTAARRILLVRVRNNRRSEQKGTVRLNLPSGWRSEPPTGSFSLAGQGDEASVRLEVSAGGSGPGTRESQFVAQVVAEAEGQSSSTGYQVVDYPHIQSRHWFQPAVAKLLRFDLQVPSGLRVGYVMGSGDEAPEALKQMGVAVELLGPDDLAFGDLQRFDTIVTGIRAYEVRKDVSVNQARLMDYVRNGGVLIVQYSRSGGYSDPLGPYPLKLGSGPRVTVEEAPVGILVPSHPLFQSPNKITQADFNGWVQERGTYFLESWDPQYQPMLESYDPGESPLRGGMLLASYGKGYYLYSGYTWFRQLPEGVPGAYRIFANMVSLGKTLAGRPQP